MNTLGTKNNNKGLTSSGRYNLPLMLRDNAEENSLTEDLFLSVIAHPAIVGFLWLLIKALLLLLAFLGITLPIFQKIQPPVKDIQFVLVNQHEQKFIYKHTKFKAVRKTRAGGEHNPVKQISHSKALAAAKSTPRKVNAPSKHKSIMQKSAKSNHQHSAQYNTSMPPRPRATNSYPRPKMSHRTPFSMPIPRIGPIGPISSGSGSFTSAPTGNYSVGGPSSLISSNGYSSGSGKHKGNGHSFGGEGSGNPGSGRHGGSGGDAFGEADLGAYVSGLQRRLKVNWSPPKGEEDKRVVVYFRISKNGRLLFVRVRHSSGNPEVDEAARSAVKQSAPFRQLPSEYEGSSIDINFTFDYNVHGGSVRGY